MVWHLISRQAGRLFALRGNLGRGVLGGRIFLVPLPIRVLPHALICQLTRSNSIPGEIHDRHRSGALLFWCRARMSVPCVPDVRAIQFQKLATDGAAALLDLVFLESGIAS
jgi:hypothetical protein